jgi:thiol-disulfide isomerase/thioredoxin
MSFTDTLKNYFKKKTKFALIIDALMGIMLILFLIPATRKDMAALILKPTLFIHQPKVNDEKPALLPETYKWVLKDMTGERISISKFSDKVIFINLWATWCPPCIAEMPDLQKLYNDYGDKVEFLFVSNESTDVINSFLEKKKFTLPAYTPVSQYPSDFETQSIPTTFIINKKGEIVIRKAGVAQWNSKRMRGILDALIASE